MQQARLQEQEATLKKQAAMLQKQVATTQALMTSLDQKSPHKFKAAGGTAPSTCSAHQARIISYETYSCFYPSSYPFNDGVLQVQVYSHIGGYKMRLTVYANGKGAGADTNVSVFLYLMKGEYDDNHFCPSNLDLTFELVNCMAEKAYYQ